LRRRLTALGIALLVVWAVVGLATGGDERGPKNAVGLPPRPVRFTVAASGDLLIHGPVFRQALLDGGGDRYDFRPMLRWVRRVVAPADIALCHLEQPLTHGEPQGEPVFRAPAELAGGIRWAGWDACSTASNHALDGGEDGIRSTLRDLDKQDLRHAGTYGSPHARRPALLQVKGVRVAFLAYTQRIVGMPRPQNGWSLAMAEPDRIIADARAARRSGAGMVVVSVHWGDEYRHQPSPFQRRLAVALTGSGVVDAVIGQHVHVVQPIRRVNGKPVVYGEGNLLSNQTAACCPAASQDGLIALLEVRAGPDGVAVERVRHVPTWVRHPDFRVVAAPAASRRRTEAVVSSPPRSG